MKVFVLGSCRGVGLPRLEFRAGSEVVIKIVFDGENVGLSERPSSSIAVAGYAENFLGGMPC